MRPPPFLIVALALVACVTTSQVQAHDIRKGDVLLRWSTVAGDCVDPSMALLR